MQFDKWLPCLSGLTTAIFSPQRSVERARQNVQLVHIHLDACTMRLDVATFVFCYKACYFRRLIAGHQLLRIPHIYFHGSSPHKFYTLIYCYQFLQMLSQFLMLLIDFGIKPPVHFPNTFKYNPFSQGTPSHLSVPSRAFRHSLYYKSSPNIVHLIEKLTTHPHLKR